MMAFHDILYCYEWWEDNPEKDGRLTGLKGKVLRGLTSELINTFVVEHDGIPQQQVKINLAQKGSRAGITTDLNGTWNELIPWEMFVPRETVDMSQWKHSAFGSVSQKRFHVFQVQRQLNNCGRWEVEGKSTGPRFWARLKFCFEECHSMAM